VQGTPPLIHAFAVAAALAALFVAAPAAGAARLAKPSERSQLIRAAASSPAGEAIQLRLRRGGRLALSPNGLVYKGSSLAVRSLIDPDWALLVVEPQGRSDWRTTFLLERSRGRWRSRMAAGAGEAASALCRRREPGTAVTLDLGLETPPFGRCRHRRDRRKLVRPMTASEVASVRAMVEWRYDPNAGLVPGPKQPEAAEFSASDCAWDGRGSVLEPARGEVSRANPRWGAVEVTCVTGSDGFALLENPTLILVSRSGRDGSFTRAHAHTFMSWSLQGGLCSRPRWPVPAAPRVALDFCWPFPAALRGLS